MAQAESYVNMTSRKNWSDAYAGLNDDIKRLLSETVSNLAAIYGIQYNMSGFTSRVEAEDMINILFARSNINIEFLKDDRSVKFMESA